MADPFSAKLIDALAKALAQETITGLKGKLSSAKKYDLFGTALQTYIGRMEERYNAELEARFHRDTRRIGQIRETKEGVEVVKSLQRIIVLGKPGAGKTTFLRYVTLLALDGKPTENRLPILVSLVEMADFNDEQIQTFIGNWFAHDAKTAAECWAEMNTTENAPIKELAAIPLLLALLCITYRKRLVCPASRKEKGSDLYS